MDINDLKGRIYFLAGQLEEAKKVYKDALGEIERDKKEQINGSTEEVITSNNKEVSDREPATV